MHRTIGQQTVELTDERINNNNNTNNSHDDIYSAVIMAEPLQEFTWFTRRIQKRHQVAADLWTKPTGPIEPQARL